MTGLNPFDASRTTPEVTPPLQRDPRVSVICNASSAGNSSGLFPPANLIEPRDVSQSSINRRDRSRSNLSKLGCCCPSNFMKWKCKKKSLYSYIELSLLINSILIKWKATASPVKGCRWCIAWFLWCRKSPSAMSARLESLELDQGTRPACRSGPHLKNLGNNYLFVWQ